MSIYIGIYVTRHMNIIVGIRRSTIVPSIDITMNVSIRESICVEQISISTIVHTLFFKLILELKLMLI